MFDGNLGLIMALAIILCATKLLGLAARKIGLPQVLGYIVAGLLIGPAIFGFLGFSIIGFDNSGIDCFIKVNNFTSSSGEKNLLDVFSKIGVILIMFSAGLETNIKHIKETGLMATMIACAGVAVPLILGTLVSMCFMGTGILDNGMFVFDNIFQCLYVGVILTATSVAITVSVLKELKVINSKIATTVVSAAIIDDVIGMIILSIVTSLFGGDAAGTGFVWFKAQWWGAIILTVAFFAVAIGIGFLCHMLFTWLSDKFPRAERISLFGLVICFSFSFLAEEVFGIADITGAYIAGIMLSTVKRTAYWTERNVDANTFMLFGPIFFACIGMEMSFDNVNGWLLLFAILIALVGLIGKIIGCGAVVKIGKWSWREAGIAGFGMMARGEVALIITNKGIEIGLISPQFMLMTVLLILISSILTPIMLKVLFKKYVPYSMMTGEILLSPKKRGDNADL